MENNLDNAKKYLLETNFEFFTQAEQNVIGKTMVAYTNCIKSEVFEKNQQLIQEKIAIKLFRDSLLKILQDAEDQNILEVGTQNFKRYIEHFYEESLKEEIFDDLDKEIIKRYLK